jgi:uncharacterized RDD family membrane protein YckC
MKCPKCNYIAFDSTLRCRNCGFDFSLSPVTDPGADLPLRTEEPAAPLADFDLGGTKRAQREAPVARSPRLREGLALDPGVPPAPASELPLFFDELPLVRPSAPSAPLAVRRSTPVPSRPRPPVIPRMAEPTSDVGLPLSSPYSAIPSASPIASSAASADGDVAGMGVRVGAAAIDWLMLLALDLVVVYFTVRVSRLAIEDMLLLPPAPLAAFLLLLNGGYLALFTAAGGQTIGKMAFHLKVVSAGEQPLTIGRSLVRVVAFFLSALPAGLGLLPAAFDQAHRGVHDRLAETRVVHATGS